MTKPATVSGLRLAAALTIGVALFASVQAASAKGDHRRNKGAENTGASPHFVISGQPANVKRVVSDKKNEKRPKKGCEKIIVPTAECGVSSKDPVGSTHPGGATASSNPPAGGTTGKSSSGNTVTISNGVTKIDVPYNPGGLIISSNIPGTITVFNGSTSQTLRGGSITLSGAGIKSGADSVQTTPGLQTVRLTNGDISIGSNPTAAGPPAKPTSGTNNGPPGVGPGDNFKDLGKTAANGAAVVAVSPVVATSAAAMIAFGALVATIDGHPIKGTKEIAKDIVNTAGSVIEWASGWF